MNVGPELLLIGAVAAVGVLHTIVPDHWVPITLIAVARMTTIPRPNRTQINTVCTLARLSPSPRRATIPTWLAVRAVERISSR